MRAERPISRMFSQSKANRICKPDTSERAGGWSQPGRLFGAKTQRAFSNASRRTDALTREGSGCQHYDRHYLDGSPDIGFDSYDRFFPNQDTLPQGGFGNLIALPLQKQPRERGNSLFLDDDFNPHADQWVFLSSIGKIDRA
jgi:hypothetical protein